MLDRRSLFRAAIGSWMGRHKLKDAAEELLKKADDAPDMGGLSLEPMPSHAPEVSAKYRHLRNFLDRAHSDTFRKHEQKRELIRLQEHAVQQFKSWGHGFKLHVLKQEWDRAYKEEIEEHNVINRALQLIDERYL